MLITNELRLPQAIYNAVARDDYDRGLANISVTGLLDPPRKRVLEERHNLEIEVDVSEMIYALIGKSIHKILSEADENAIVDERLYTTCRGWKVSGSFDRLVLMPTVRNETNLHVLQDYKMCSVWEAVFDDKPEREQQLNLYAELLRRNNYPAPDIVENIMIFRDWSKTKSRRDDSHPRHQVTIKQRTLWEPAKAAAFMEKRVQMHQAAGSAGEKNLPLCTDEDRWKSPPKFAVTMVNRKKALRVLNSATLAEAWADDYIDKNPKAAVSIEERPAEAKRCADYCYAAEWCSQHQDDLATEKEKAA